MWIRDISVRIRSRIHACDQWIRTQILLFSSLTFKMPTKKYFFFSSFSAHYFLLFLLDDRRIRIRIRIRTSEVRIQEAQKQKTYGSSAAGSTTLTGNIESYLYRRSRQSPRARVAVLERLVLGLDSTTLIPGKANQEWAASILSSFCCAGRYKCFSSEYES